MPTSRRQFLTRTARGAGAAICGGAVWALVIGEQADATPYVLRPPGAREESDFLSRCIKCGQCVVDCPYDTLALAAPGDPYPVGTPFFVPRDEPCHLCPDLPCVRACPTAALDPELTDANEADMGLAVLVDQDNCLSYQGLRCEICHRVCPLQDEAISVAHHPRTSSKHALFIPIVHSDACTGCGICEQACPLPEPTIRVMPRGLTQGRGGEHYRLGWRIDTPMNQVYRPRPSRSERPLAATSGLDYLNEDAL